MLDSKKELVFLHMPQYQMLAINIGTRYNAARSGRGADR
jgi:hypothetical protein